MQKEDIIHMLTVRLCIEELQVAGIVDELLDEICRGLQQEAEVDLPEFGVFRKIIKPERIGRNPVTGVEIVISPTAEITFDASAELLRIINQQS
ncbi:HU family DNA-binding protein [Paenibacillus methanolicus]|uniref:DNA-binding protein HU-beta/integration host factor subunit alpha n=1 Tax=Paenibacillus methanolicus TaxID=582686 RepID=A0A5S5C1T3_9BACL|nr:HU family DNA-binding protein [Paenibacillus methanolicus]TYP73264.1 DNA-binding protein HU-beta/integration host factor subunit alpha [Paenibacillus methanolicus]